MLASSILPCTGQPSEEIPLRTVLFVSLALVLITCALAFVLLRTYVPAAVDPAWAVGGDGVPSPGAVTVRFTGTSTLLFDDGETAWMIDGWFSRPGPLETLFGAIEPDLDAITKGLAANGNPLLAAVIPAHSHYDHAMDAPEVARRTGALLVGSEATAQIGRGWGLPESRIRVMSDGESITLGRFEITLHASRHFEFPDPALRERALADPEISEPLVPPVGAFEYRLGRVWAIHVRHPSGSWLVQASAGFVPGAFEGLSADVVFLGTGGLGTQTPAYREAYWRETVGRTAPHTVVPIHWDSLTGPIEGPFTGPVRAAGFLSGGTRETLAFLKEKQAAHPALRFVTLPRYAPVVLFEPSRP